MKSALIIYPHQLYPADLLPQVDMVFMVEEPLYFGVDTKGTLKIHKQKLILHRASMRRYVEEVLWPINVDVEYLELDPLLQTSDLFDKVRNFSQVYLFDPVDDTLLQRVLRARREQAPKTNLELLTSPNFYLGDQEIRSYINDNQTYKFPDFYQWQRERFNILINSSYKPLGGKWIFDSENKERLPENHVLPSFEVFGDNQHVKDAIAWVDKYFSGHPGGTDFIYPTNHAEAAAWLNDFVEHRLDEFGPYEEAIDGTSPWIYHSVLSSSLNIGLLSPQQVVQAALERNEARPVPIHSLEAFIRQVIGWREYVRGIYVTQGPALHEQNTFNHNRQLTSAWYDGTLGLPPLDDMILKLQKHAYSHHTERLMIAGNLMMLCEINPRQIHRWFSELHVDAFDWVLWPNIYGLSQFVTEGVNLSRLPISASNHLLQMSHYEKGDWCDVWDGLFWRFVEKHKDYLAKNPQLRMLTSQLETLDPDRKRIITYRAEDFLKSNTA